MMVMVDSERAAGAISRRHTYTSCVGWVRALVYLGCRLIEMCTFSATFDKFARNRLMGLHASSRRCASTTVGAPVSLAQFDILRAIGKGTFGKVCIVRQHRRRCGGGGGYFALKYMNKYKCVQLNAVHNVLREIDLLAELDHPFLVNLWYTFQDAEDMFIVFDLLTGGDLRYHLNQDGRFSEDRVKLYTCEMALALDYLQRSHKIVHRDVKPENIVLDAAGHAHLTDFNVATRLNDDSLATSMTGTRPYMAIEILSTTLNECAGYGLAVDWWSLGVCFYEMLRGRRPFEVSSHLTVRETRDMLLLTAIPIPVEWPDDLVAFLSCLIDINPDRRISTIDQFTRHQYMARIDLRAVLRRETAPMFVPKTDSLNCDPTFELEELIVESRPLHKKRSRLKKEQHRHRHKGHESVVPSAIDNVRIEALAAIDRDFRVYNREQVLMNEAERISRLERELGEHRPS